MYVLIETDRETKQPIRVTSFDEARDAIDALESNRNPELCMVLPLISGLVPAL